MRQHFKLYIQDIKIKSFNQEVTSATVTARVLVPEKYFYMDYDNMVGLYDEDHIVVHATTRLHKEDTFDEETGRRIAESKAMIKAYKKYISFLTKITEYFNYCLYGNKKPDVNILASQRGGIYDAIDKAKANLDSEIAHFQSLMMKCRFNNLNS